MWLLAKTATDQDGDVKKLRFELVAEQDSCGPEQLRIGVAARQLWIDMAADQIDCAPEQLHMGMAAK